MADKILIVDDDPAICKLLEKVMHSNELETTTVNCGMDALSILKNHTFDLILMDIMLGDMEGFAVHSAMIPQPCVFTKMAKNLSFLPRSLHFFCFL